jgi:prolipoprotein diacylglyceryltransferase
MTYLILAGVERFGIEFIRINERFALGLSEAQLIALGLIAVGLIGRWKLRTIHTPSKSATV